MIPGRGPNVDTVRTQLKEGSFVIQRPAVDALGSNNIHKFVSNYNEGGQVKSQEGRGKFRRKTGRSGGTTKVEKD